MDTLFNKLVEQLMRFDGDECLIETILEAHPTWTRDEAVDLLEAVERQIASGAK